MNGLKRKWRQICASWRLGGGVSGKARLILQFWKLSRPVVEWHPMKHIIIPLQMNECTVPLTLRDSSSDMIIFREIFVEGDYDALKMLSWQPEVIYDVGANAGLAAVFMHEKFPRARIIGFEPGLSEHKVASCNYTALGQEPPYAVAAWNCEGEMSFLEDPDRSGGQHLQPDGGAGRKVRTVRMDEFMQERALPVPELVKMDIEGAEVAALSGFGEHLRNVRAVLLETHSAALHAECLKILGDQGMSVRYDKARDGTARILLMEQNG